MQAKKNIQHIFTALVFSLILVSFAWFSLFGLISTIVAMEHGIMMDCVFSGQFEKCTMNLGEHVNTWNIMFNLLVPIAASLSLSFLVVMLVVLTSKKHTSTDAFLFLKSQLHLYAKLRPVGFFFDYVKEALSQGILHPKIYS